ncbi:MAG: hypothetical protein IPN81_10740 [Nitrosomonadales bacterium]|nr:hypothetical protein [Nitrosomonadales bacterium]
MFEQMSAKCTFHRNCGISSYRCQGNAGARKNTGFAIVRAYDQRQSQ